MYQLSGGLCQVMDPLWRVVVCIYSTFVPFRTCTLSQNSSYYCQTLLMSCMFRSSGIRALDQYLSRYFVQSGCSWFKTELICLSHALVSPLKGLLQHGKPNTVSGTSFVCSFSAALCSFSVRASNDCGWSFLSFSLIGAAMRAKFGIHCQYPLCK